MLCFPPLLQSVESLLLQTRHYIRMPPGFIPKLDALPFNSGVWDSVKLLLRQIPHSSRKNLQYADILSIQLTKYYLYSFADAAVVREFSR